MSDKPPHGGAEERWCEAHQTMHPISEFYKIKSPRYKGGYRYECKVIKNQQVTKARRNAPEGSGLRESMRKASRKWKQDNPEANRKHTADSRARKKQQSEQGSSSE